MMEENNDDFSQAFSQKTNSNGGKKWAISTTSLLIIVLFISLIVTIRWIHIYVFTGPLFQKPILRISTNQTKKFSLNCFPENTTQACPNTLPPKPKIADSSAEECPDYFRWIHQDLNRWKGIGISKELVESGKGFADLRILVVNGKLYVEKYRGVFQTRDVFTVWGILQLLRLYPGRLPDVDLMFACGDKPMVGEIQFRSENAKKVPPVFHYCADDSSLDIVFPDWSFWGWPEINIKPWEVLKNELEEGNKRKKWMEREAYAYWKGNTDTSWSRNQLLMCSTNSNNSSQPSRLRIYKVDWRSESQQGFKDSNLATQCTHRYKIYVEGIAWSVSEKYILACDSMSLLVTPHFHDFFTRSLVPTIHYWPINENNRCNSVKFAVDWGNNNTKKAQEIGRAGSKFIQEQLKMKNVYDYMFHLLNDYSKLLTYKPIVPEGATEVCIETIACKAEGLYEKFLMESMVEEPQHTISPCALPPPYHPQALLDFLERKEKLTKKVERWESSGDVLGVNFEK